MTDAAGSRAASWPAWAPTARPEQLVARARVVRQLRSGLEDDGFIEVHTPVLSQHTVIDRYIEPLSIALRLPGESEPREYFLQTSPEAGMKRLLAGGLERIYQIGPVFRGEEVGPWHNPEFTMLEWYAVGDGYTQGIERLERLVQTVLATPAATRTPFADAFAEHTGLHLDAGDWKPLAAWSTAQGLVPDAQWSDDWDEWVNLIFSARIQPRLGFPHPQVITHFPASQAALAKLSSEHAGTAERFELFYRGVELANGYHELLDASVLRQRDEQANQQRAALGRRALPPASGLLAAMEAGLPSCAGCALGLDRLVMLAIGATTLHEVLCFPIDRA